MMYHGYHFFGMHLLWWAFWIGLLAWIFLVWKPWGGQKKERDSPAEILKRRLARGEIDGEEYEALRRTLDDDA